MAHAEHTKAQALALLMLGNSPRHVAEQMGVPLTTVRRWRPEAVSTWGEIAPDLCQEVRRALPGLRKMAPKKRVMCRR